MSKISAPPTFDTVSRTRWTRQFFDLALSQKVSHLGSRVDRAAAQRPFWGRDRRSRDRRPAYLLQVELWAKGGHHVERLPFAGNSARCPRARLTIRQRTRVVAEWPWWAKSRRRRQGGAAKLALEIDIENGVECARDTEAPQKSPHDYAFALYQRARVRSVSAQRQGRDRRCGSWSATRYGRGPFTRQPNRWRNSPWPYST
jgi:hypothetical protein